MEYYNGSEIMIFQCVGIHVTFKVFMILLPIKCSGHGTYTVGFNSEVFIPYSTKYLTKFFY